MSAARWIALIALAGCATAPQTRIEADPPISLAGFSTYEWSAPPAAADISLSDRARVAVARELAAHGLAGGADADITVTVSLAARPAKQVFDFGDAFFIPGHGPHPGIHLPGAYPRYEVRTYTQAQLAIAIHDARDERLLWRGIAAGPVDPGNAADIDRLVDALFMRAAE
jgi:hypothetical protein